MESLYYGPLLRLKAVPLFSLVRQVKYYTPYKCNELHASNSRDSYPKAQLTSNIGDEVVKLESKGEPSSNNSLHTLQNSRCSETLLVINSILNGDTDLEKN